MNIKTLPAKLSTVAILSAIVLFVSGCSNLPVQVPIDLSENKSIVTTKTDKYIVALQERISQAMVYRPELFEDEFKEDIIKGVVKVGMNIDQAIIAGGDFSFAVSADKKVWGEDPNPYYVISAQFLNPDDSDIKLTFYNNTQFDELASFRVQIIRGKVASITRL